MQKVSNRKKIEQVLDEEVKSGIKKALEEAHFKETEAGARFAAEPTRRRMEKIARAEASKHSVERETGVYVRKVCVNPDSGAVTVHLPPKIVSDLHLEGKESCKWEQEGDAWAMTPLKETSIPMSIHLISSSALGLTVPDEMLVAAGLKSGDYVEWKEEEGRLSLRKAEGPGPSTTKVLVVDTKNVLTIPSVLTMELKIEKGMFGIWTFEEDEEGKRRLWLELAHGNPDITRIGIGEEGVENQGLTAKLPQGMEGSFKTGDEAVLEVKDGKLFIRPKQA